MEGKATIAREGSRTIDKEKTMTPQLVTDKDDVEITVKFKKGDYNRLVMASRELDVTIAWLVERSVQNGLKRVFKALTGRKP